MHQLFSAMLSHRNRLASSEEKRKTEKDMEEAGEEERMKVCFSMEDALC